MKEEYEQSFLNAEEQEEESAYFELLIKLKEENASRYEAQATSLLKAKELEVLINNKILHFAIENRGCTFRISRDGGFEYVTRGWTRLNGSKRNKINSLIFYFAGYEARILAEL